MTRQPIEEEPVLDHLSIQCADVQASARFYDAVLATLGGRRIMEFGSVIGYGVPPMPDFWLGPQETGDGFREAHIAFGAPDRPTVDRFFQAAVEHGAERLHDPRIWPEYAVAIARRQGFDLCVHPATGRLLAALARASAGGSSGRPEREPVPGWRGCTGRGSTRLRCSPPAACCSRTDLWPMADWPPRTFDGAVDDLRIRLFEHRTW